MRGSIVLEDGSVIDANWRDDNRVNLQARGADGRLLLALRLTQEQVDDLVGALWSSASTGDALAA
jgi:hypothetical protein